MTSEIDGKEVPRGLSLAVDPFGMRTGRLIMSVGCIDGKAGQIAVFSERIAGVGGLRIELSADMVVYFFEQG